MFSLKNRGHEITVLTGRPNYPTGKFFDGYSNKSDDLEFIQSIPIYRSKLRERKNGSGINLFLNYFSFAYYASKKVTSLAGDFDVIFVYEPSPITVGIPAIKAAKKFKAPIVFWVQDLWPESLKAAGGINNRIVLGVFDRLTRYIYNNSKLILIQSRAFKKYIVDQNIPDRKIKYFPNNTESFYKPVDKFLKYKEYFDNSKTNLLFAGNIGEAQSFETLIRAAKLTENLAVNWVILGDGRYKERALKLIEELNIQHLFKFIGSFPAKEMPYFFSNADALLVSLKKSDIFSMTIPAKVQSYMACQKPLIASLDGEGARIIEEANCGYTSPSENIELLAKNIEKFIKLNLEEKKKLGGNSLNYFKKEFEKEKLLNTLESYFNLAIES